MNRLLRNYVQIFYEIFYYRLFSNAIAIRRKDTILGSIYAKIMKWPEIIELKDGRFTLTLPQTYAKILVNEANLWNKWYGSDFKDKVILDVGAGAGETASFFFNRGAKMVIAVEQNPNALTYLRKNRTVNGWTLPIIESAFKLEHLSLPHDYMKMDIEGGEIELLKYDGELCHCSLEVHPEVIGKKNVDRIIEKFNLKAITKPRVYGHD